MSLLALACGGGDVAPTVAPATESPGATSAPAPTADGTATSRPVSQTATSVPAATEGRPHPSPLPEGEGTASAPAEAPSASEETRPTGPAPMVEPDPNYEDALDAARFRTGGWKTDFSLHTVAYDEFLSGGVPRDGIPPLDDPQFESIADADSWLEDVQPVVSLEVNGQARAYPLAILTWHEIANDTVGGVPVSVTFCPLCNSAVAFDRRLGDVTLDFGVSGNLRHSDLVMWDRQTESWWQQLTGEGIVGVYAGYRLNLVPAQIVSWADFRAAFPDADVLSRDTGHSRDYGRNPYYGYDRVDQSPFLFQGRPDDRLLPMERVAALELDGQPLAFPFMTLEREGAVNYEANGRSIVVLFQPGTASALDQSRIAESRDVGATGVFDAELDGQMLTFRVSADGFADDQTGSVWNVLGQAVSGPLAGQSLTPIVHGNHFWFAWAAYAPETVVY
ncbi:MAG: DUF3179 domain-containing protein, partial [Chloroflexi bacterium]|nr:DUF3179 domain-containing protein [Chloroflexota bacterium]